MTESRGGHATTEGPHWKPDPSTHEPQRLRKAADEFDQWAKDHPPPEPPVAAYAGPSGPTRADGFKPDRFQGFLDSYWSEAVFRSGLPKGDWTDALASYGIRSGDALDIKPLLTRWEQESNPFNEEIDVRRLTDAADELRAKIDQIRQRLDADQSPRAEYAPGDVLKPALDSLARELASRLRGLADATTEPPPSRFADTLAALDLTGAQAQIDANAKRAKELNADVARLESVKDAREARLRTAKDKRDTAQKAAAANGLSAEEQAKWKPLADAEAEYSRLYSKYRRTEASISRRQERIDALDETSRFLEAARDEAKSASDLAKYWSRKRAETLARVGKQRAGALFGAAGPDLASQLSSFGNAFRTMKTDGLVETTKVIQRTLESYLAAAQQELLDGAGRLTVDGEELCGTLRALADSVASNIQYLVKNNVNGAGQPRW